MRAAAALAFAALFAVSAIAETTFVGTRVSRADYPEPDVMAPLPPLLPGAPVRLLFYYPSDDRPPVATVHGDTIEVTETISLDPPLQKPALYLIDIGPQAEGTYHVVMNRTYVQKGVLYPGTYSLTYLVQPTPASSPCSALPPAKVPLVHVTRTASGTAHLHFEEIRSGYAPMWGVPAVVDVRKDAIDVQQTLSDVSAPLLHATCHAEDIDLGELAPGSYTVQWGAVAKFGEQMLVSPNVIGFQWNGMATTCSTTPELSVSPGLTLSLRRMTISTLRAPAVAEVKGNVITVVDAVQTALPPSLSYPTPRCMASSVTVGPLAPGDYTVNWQAAEELLAPEPIGTFHLTMPAPRSRAVRH